MVYLRRYLLWQASIASNSSMSNCAPTTSRGIITNVHTVQTITHYTEVLSHSICEGYDTATLMLAPIVRTLLCSILRLVIPHVAFEIANSLAKFGVPRPVAGSQP